MASKAEVFVTHDGELARRLNRIPVVGFTAIGSLWPIPPTEVSAGEHTTSARDLVNGGEINPGGVW